MSELSEEAAALIADLIVEGAQAASPVISPDGRWVAWTTLGLMGFEAHSPAWWQGTDGWHVAWLAAVPPADATAVLDVAVLGGEPLDLTAREPLFHRARPPDRRPGTHPFLVHALPRPASRRLTGLMSPYRPWCRLAWSPGP